MYLNPSWATIPPNDIAGALPDSAHTLIQVLAALGASITEVHILERSNRLALTVRNLIDLGHSYPRLQVLHMRNVVPTGEGVLNAPPRFPVFAQLVVLSVTPLHAALGPGDSVTKSLFDVFAQMPCLRALTVRRSAAGRTQFERALAESSTRLPEPPFRLHKLVRTGTLTVAACARIVSCSRHTLLELCITGLAEDPESLLVAQAAPHIRTLDLGGGGNGRLVDRVGPVFAQLARLDTLRLRAPRNATLGLLSLAPSCVPLRSLILVDAGVPEDPSAVLRLVRQIVDELPQMRRLTRVVLVDFCIGDRDIDGGSELIRNVRDR
ncbi:hypothetical protein AURDEDRAFT_176175 [Auricularia subglabra TFB-10046 SS5]|uniref:F-box domain-containing protein n=1 Tax=Auricularia subglabra (strain TFB-10046 / SS5) TaxID=717982 RepID=J0D734_AURST|nr:hypothetical protein AURDEDRAFT_176175 [Auricularia subglabra TFB-10046 SS5]